MIQDIAPSHLDNQFYQNMIPQDNDPVIVFKEDKLLLHASATKGAGSDSYDPKFILPTKSLLPANSKLQFLFKFDGQAYYLALTSKRFTEKALTEVDIYSDQIDTSDASEAEESGFDEDGNIVLEDYTYVRLHAIRSDKIGSKAHYFMAVTAYQLHRWHLNNRFCGRCGHSTRLATTERAIQCPSCGNRIYPKIVPAVIVGVTNGNSLLLTKYANRGIGYDALVAGFTEIGETLEETVEREVMEETGLKVKNIRYYKSQPWGVVDDILAGFYCDVDGDTTIKRDEEELKEARWVKREDITGQPDHLSLTNEMMLVFRDGKEPK